MCSGNSNGQRSTQSTVATHCLTVDIAAANKGEACVNKVLVDKQKEKVEAMEAIFVTVAQLTTPVSTDNGGRSVVGVV